MLDERITAELVGDYIRELAASGQRKDGRAFDEVREIKIRPGTFTKAEGEAWVSLGATQVLVGVKADVGTPFPDTPDKGVLISNVELLPLASPTFEPGPPDENAIEMARVVDRALRGSNAIDMEALAIKSGELVYMIFLDMYALDHDGNIIDAFALGSLVALSRTRIPVVEVTEDGEMIVKEETFDLPIRDLPITFTFIKIGDALMLDPTLEEELVSDAAITISIDSSGRVCSIQKRHGSFRVDEIKRAVSIARSKYSEVERILREQGGLV